jgi:hypothetical protein
MRELKITWMILLALLFVRTAMADFSLLSLVPPSVLTTQSNLALREFGESVLVNNSSVIFNQEQLKDADFEQTVRMSLQHECDTAILRYYAGDHPADEVLSFKTSVDLQNADPLELQKLAINPKNYSNGYPLTVKFNARMTGCKVDCFGRTVDFGSTKVVVDKTCKATIVPERTSHFRLDEGELQ